MNYFCYFGNSEILKIALLELSEHIKPDGFLALLEYLMKVLNYGHIILLTSRFNPVTVRV
jgi:hypothetical protein